MKILAVIAFVLIATAALVGVLAVGLPFFSRKVFAWDAALKRLDVKERASSLATFGLLLNGITGLFFVLLGLLATPGSLGAKPQNAFDALVFIALAFLVRKRQATAVRLTLFGYALARFSLWGLRVDHLSGVFVAISIFSILFAFTWLAMEKKTLQVEHGA